MTGPLPSPTPETRPFWDAASEGRLSIQRCRTCARHYFYPRPFCPRCSSDEVEWTDVSGRATLLSYLVNHRPLPPFDRGVAIVEALVALEEGPHMMTMLVGVERPEELQLDIALEVRFTDRDGISLPAFAPAQKVAA